MERIGKPESKHLFELEVTSEDVQGIYKIEVEADTRSKARATAENHGYVVRSVNMVG